MGIGGREVKFRTKAEVDEYLSGDQIQCLLCGKWFKAIGGLHLRHKHNMTVDEYKTEFGLPGTKALSGVATREKHRKALVARIKAGDPTLTPFTPELMWKAQHAPKRKYPDYHRSEIQKRGVVALKKRSAKRLSGIDWVRFLTHISKGGMTEGSHREAWMPSDYDLSHKMRTDPGFQKEYKTIRESQKVKNRYKADVLELTNQGLTSRAIAGKLDISKTHVQRIRGWGG